jgi:hypothetical protein
MLLFSGISTDSAVGAYTLSWLQLYCYLLLNRIDFCDFLYHAFSSFLLGLSPVSNTHYHTFSEIASVITHILWQVPEKTSFGSKDRFFHTLA